IFLVLHSFPTRRSSDLVHLSHCVSLLRLRVRSRDVVCAAVADKHRQRRVYSAASETGVGVSVGWSINYASDRRSYVRRARIGRRSEEHTSELQSRGHLV